MEQSMPEIARKIWHIVRVTFFMLRRGICKRKILMDLNMMIKRGKIAGKALNNLLFHHHHHHHPTTSYGGSHLSYSREYEFSCSDTPLYRHYFTTHKRKTHHHHCHHYEAAAANIDAYDIDRVFEMMDTAAVEASPILPGLGFGRSPMVRQLRITDSPFPIQNADEDSHVDEAAEEFIQKFYSQLMQQQKYY